MSGTDSQGAHGLNLIFVDFGDPVVSSSVIMVSRYRAKYIQLSSQTSQCLLDALAESLVQMFIVPWGCILMIVERLKFKMLTSVVYAAFKQQEGQFRVKNPENYLIDFPSI